MTDCKQGNLGRFSQWMLDGWVSQLSCCFVQLGKEWASGLSLPPKKTDFLWQRTHTGDIYMKRGQKVWRRKNCAKSGLCGRRVNLLGKLCYADFGLFQLVSMLHYVSAVVLCWCDKPTRVEQFSLVVLFRGNDWIRARASLKVNFTEAPEEILELLRILSESRHSLLNVAIVVLDCRNCNPCRNEYKSLGLYLCSTKTREVLGNPSPTPERFPEGKARGSREIWWCDSGWWRYQFNTNWWCQ